MSRTSRTLLLQAKGLLLLALIGALIALSIAVYNKTFSDLVRLGVRVERAGMQLNANSDVRMRGALVGRVDSFDVEGDHAVIHLQIDRDEARQIPANVSARIVPTTLFGQKYVDLVTVEKPSATPIKDGAVIPVDRSRTAVELNAAIDAIEPVLTAVRPQDLSMTLEALSSGLQGRGEQIGENAVRVASYLKTFNPLLPLLVRDLREFAGVADAYAVATPDLLRLLDNSTVTSRTVLALREEFRAAYAQLTGLANVSRAFFEAFGGDIVRANALARPVAELLARYSSELTCVFQTLNIGRTTATKVVRDGKLMLTATAGQDMGPYTAADRPVNGDLGVGPACHGLPVGKRPLLSPKFDNGAELDPLISTPGGSR